MLSPLTRRPIRPIRKAATFQLRSASSQTPPPARPYRPQTAEERAANRKLDGEPEPEPQQPRSRTWRTVSKYFNPFHEPEPSEKSSEHATNTAREPRDPARGIAAAQRVVTQGVLDPRYKADARRWITMILGLVISIGLAPEVWRRTIKGENRKKVPVPKNQAEGAMDNECDDNSEKSLD